MELKEQILDFLSKHDQTDSLDLAKNFGVDHQTVIGAIKSLENIEGVSLSIFLLNLQIFQLIF